MNGENLYEQLDDAWALIRTLQEANREKDQLIVRLMVQIEEMAKAADDDE